MTGLREKGLQMATDPAAYRRSTPIVGDALLAKDAIENKDWQSAELVAQTALKMTQEPIPILCQLETVYTQWHDHELNNLWSQLGSAYLRIGQIDLAERTYRKDYEK